MKFTGSVKNGKLTLTDKTGFKQHLSQIDGDVWLDVKPLPKSRSPKQNSYYRAIIRDLGNEFGYTEQEMHQTAKDLFSIKSTKDLSIEEFSDFLDRIIVHFAQLGYPVEDPRGR